MKLLGSLDRCDEDLIEGWITVAEHPAAKLALDIMLDTNVVGQCVADQYRKDLDEVGLGGGHCAFSFKTPGFIAKSQLQRVSIRLQDSPLFMSSHSRATSGVDGIAGETVSRFGGMWIDRHDWLDRLALKHRTGEISEALSVSIFRFVRDGYFIIEGAVDPSLVAVLNNEIDLCWRSPPEGLRIETFEPDGKMRIVPPDLRWREGRTKMLDLYACSHPARVAITAKKVMEFLSAIFEDQPKAFQGLTFWNGSQQAIHKDTAYVKVDSNPMHLAATWMALEDIEAGTGELEYYIGSHRAPDFLFNGTNKWMESRADEHSKFLASLQDDAKLYDQIKGSFLARKGDVLIWHADLAHGGSAIATAGRSRRSLVTHFTPSSDEPYYRRTAAHQGLVENGCMFISEHGDVI